MFDRAGSYGKALSFLIVWTMVAGGFVAVVATLPPAAQAGVCDQVGGVITGDWTVSTAQTCTGMFTVDGTITVAAAGSLTLVDGGLRFAKDMSHIGYSLVVTGSLVLDNSVVTTVTEAIDPYLHLALTLNAGSSLSLRNGASLKFPGWFNATSATINITDSMITGFTSAEIAGLFSSSAWDDASDDAPLMVWTSSTVSIYRSRIERLFEHTAGAEDLRLRGGTSAYIYDTYLGIDFSEVSTEHNELLLDGSSNAYLYNVTIDASQSPASLDLYDSAFQPTAAGDNIYFHRWLHVTAQDSAGGLLAGASVWSRLSPGSTTAQFPDTGGSTPSSRTLWYLQRTSGTWNVTDAAGYAKIPLYTDRIDTSSLPNAESFGNYDETARYGTATAQGHASFSPYPFLSVNDNNEDLTLSFTGVGVCSSSVTTWSTDRTVTGSISVGDSIEISADIVIRDGSLYVDQQPNGCAYIRVLSGGSLTLENADLASNFRLVIEVASGGSLVATDGSQLLLTQRAVPGLFRSLGTATVSLSDGAVDGNVSLLGAGADLQSITFFGPSLEIDTSSGEPVRLWDPVFSGVTALALLSDDGNANTLDFDIRNASFDAVLTPQLLFSGSQNVQMTSVGLYDPSGTWWDGMIAGNAIVSRYWWLTLRSVDGTGTLLANANVSVDLDRIDPSTLARVDLPGPGSGNVYMGNRTTWRVGTSLGYILYRAFSESRTSSPSGRVVDNTYKANASALLDGSTYYADAEIQVSVTQDIAVDLEFSSLTPDLSVIDLRVSGGNGNFASQPLNTALTLTARVRNTGQIDVQSVMVSFFADNVDKNNDGVMDFSTSDFRTSAGIDDRVIALVPKNGEVEISAVWTPLGTVESSRTVSAVVDPPLVTVTDDGAVRETNPLNNIYARTFTLFTWPDLSVGSADVTTLTDPVVSNTVQLRVTVRNDGTNVAADASLVVLDNGAPIPGIVTFTVNKGLSTTLSVPWRPTSTGNHTITVRVSSDNGTIRNTDYSWVNNEASVIFQVLTQPDPALQASDQVPPPTDIVQGRSFLLTIAVRNLGQTSASNLSLAVYFDSTRSQELGRKTGINVREGDVEPTTVSVAGINFPGSRALFIVVDPDNLLNEGGVTQENNNFLNLTVTINPPVGEIAIELPLSNVEIEPGRVLLVTGFVVSGVTAVPNVDLTVEVRANSDNTLVGSGSTNSVSDGRFTFQVQLSANARDDTYTVRVNATSGGITPGTVQITIRKVVPFLDQPVPLLGISWLFMLIILAAVAAIVVGATLYFKFYGLGKMVECGECGAFIPEDATRCPKCGVEFEKDMAKCSNCQAWIPVDVKQCPECGVQFATGQVEMADYQEKMRLQYDEVVQKFKEEASRQLGRALSDREFQEWWRKQPTFVTFEDWLREEEEMRKMGSKPCPVCGTLNSVTATVCHKCGSLLKDQRPPGGGGAGAPPAPRRAAPAPAAPAPPPAEQPPGGMQAAGSTAAGVPSGQDAIPRRVIRKPIGGQPLVQKKVIRRPAEGESTESQDQSQASENPEDEL